MKMSTAIHRTEDPTFETVEFGAVYSVRGTDTVEPWVPRKIGDAYGVDSIEPLDVPAGWDDAYEYAIADKHIWLRIARLAREAYLAHAILEVSIVPVEDEEMDTESCALLYRFTRPY